ncbi:MAG TPA: hypothetical protein VGG15_11565 [Terriglobales bacterium]
MKEIEEVLIQALPYVGYPAIATALAAAAQVIKERVVWTSTKTTLATAACFDTTAFSILLFTEDRQLKT